MYFKSHSQRSNRNRIRQEEARTVQGFGKCVGMKHLRYNSHSVNDMTTFDANEYASMTSSGLFPTRVTLRRFSV